MSISNSVWEGLDDPCYYGHGYAKEDFNHSSGLHLSVSLIGIFDENRSQVYTLTLEKRYSVFFKTDAQILHDVSVVFEEMKADQEVKSDESNYSMEVSHISKHREYYTFDILVNSLVNDSDFSHSPLFNIGLLINNIVFPLILRIQLVQKDESDRPSCVSDLNSQKLRRSSRIAAQDKTWLAKDLINKKRLSIKKLQEMLSEKQGESISVEEVLYAGYSSESAYTGEFLEALPLVYQRMFRSVLNGLRDYLTNSQC